MNSASNHGKEDLGPRFQGTKHLGGAIYSAPDALGLACARFFLHLHFSFIRLNLARLNKHWR